MPATPLASTMIFDESTVQGWLGKMLFDLRAIQDGDPNIVMVGIKTGGVAVAKQLHQQLGLTSPLSALNISFYRDDFSKIGLHPRVGPSQVAVSIEEKHIILVDDVLSTGRTVRAAMNEIFDYGRPARITLAVLVQRNGQELPICADIVGHQLALGEQAYVDLDISTMTITVGERKQ